MLKLVGYFQNMCIKICAFKQPLFCLMVLRSFVKINLLFRSMDTLKRKSPFQLR